MFALARLMQCRRWSTAAALLLALGSTPAFAWGCRGHEVIALIAAAHLQPGAARAVNQILAADPVAANLRRYCREADSLPPIANASTWADDERSLDAATGPWHYIDMPLDARRGHFDLDRVCHGACVTWAIEHFNAQLRSPHSPAERGDALRYLIHFVGDIHQPLHAVSNGDEGGNCVPVSVLGETPRLRNRATGSYAPNLHGAWDTILVEQIEPKDTPPQLAAYLDATQAPRLAAGSTDPVDWAWQSQQLAIQIAYGRLPVRIAVDDAPAASCADNHQVSRRMARLHESLDDAYIAVADAVIERQLTLAGLRLARMLNQDLGQPYSAQR